MFETIKMSRVTAVFASGLNLTEEVSIAVGQRARRNQTRKDSLHARFEPSDHYLNAMLDCLIDGISRSGATSDSFSHGIGTGSIEPLNGFKWVYDFLDDHPQYATAVSFEMLRLAVDLVMSEEFQEMLNEIKTERMNDWLDENPEWGRNEGQARSQVLTSYTFFINPVNNLLAFGLGLPPRELKIRI
jgi:hypothetical protein